MGTYLWASVLLSPSKKQHWTPAITVVERALTCLKIIPFPKKAVTPSLAPFNHGLKKLYSCKLGVIKEDRSSKGFNILHFRCFHVFYSASGVRDLRIQSLKCYL